jgi:hypothetical protein
MIMIAILSAPPNTSIYPSANAAAATTRAIPTSIGMVSGLIAPVTMRRRKDANEIGIPTIAANFQVATGIFRYR